MCLLNLKGCKMIFVIAVIAYIASFILLFLFSGIKEKALIAAFKDKSYPEGSVLYRKCDLIMGDYYKATSDVIHTPPWSRARASLRAKRTRRILCLVFYALSLFLFILSAFFEGEEATLFVCCALGCIAAAPWTSHMGAVMGTAAGVFFGGSLIGVIKLYRLAETADPDAPIYRAVLIAVFAAVTVAIVRRTLTNARRRNYTYSTYFMRNTAIVSTPFSLVIPKNCRLCTVTLEIKLFPDCEEYYLTDGISFIAYRSIKNGAIFAGASADRYAPEITFYFYVDEKKEAKDLEKLFYDFRRISMTVEFPEEDTLGETYERLLPTQKELFENYNRLIIYDKEIEKHLAEGVVFYLAFPDTESAERFISEENITDGKLSEENGGFAPKDDSRPQVTFFEKLTPTTEALNERCAALIDISAKYGGQLAMWLFGEIDTND